MSWAAKSDTLKAIERYFEVMLYLMVLSGFATLAQTGQIDPFSVWLVVAALTLRGYLVLTQKRLILPEPWTNYLTLIFVCWYGADLVWISGTFLTATVHLVLGLMVVRLFTARRDRDFILLAFLAFGLVLAASILTVDSAFLIGFGAFLLTTVATFILLDMRRSAALATTHAGQTGGSPTTQQMGVALAILTSALVVLILIIAVAIFFVLPRLSAGYLSAYSSQGELSTGFSSHVELGRTGQIQQSDAVVMHIAIAGDRTGNNSELLWRGIALNQFDGRSWSNNERQIVVRPGPDGRFMVPGAYPTTAAQSIHYRVLQEPLGSNVFFVAQYPLWLAGGYRTITTDAGGGLYTLDREHSVGMYEAASDLTRHLLYPGQSTESALATRVSPAEKKLLQLPKLDPRIKQLAQQITANSVGDYDRARKIELYLRTRYLYTLDLGRVVPKDPVAYFLFERKQGNCDYFASAMAVMLRTLGIPARVITGFRGGVFNDITSQYVVRMRNAHSWVESYFPEYGWSSFDPTPSDPSQHSRPSRIMLYIDGASSFWREWVINYDFQQQRLLGQQATNSSQRLFERTRDRRQQLDEAWLAWARQLRRGMVLAPRTWASVGIGLVVLLLLGINARSLRSTIGTRQLAAHPERAPQKAASIWYQRMTGTIARRGWRKLPTQTPAEFAKSIDDRKLQAAVIEFTDRYEKARFANSSEDAKHLPELYEALSTEG